jgi:hypothetical protein
MPCFEIEWIGAKTTEHTLRRTLSCYQRLCGFPRMQSLGEAAVAVGPTSEQIAECLIRERFPPVSILHAVGIDPFEDRAWWRAARPAKSVGRASFFRISLPVIRESQVVSWPDLVHAETRRRRECQD